MKVLVIFALVAFVAARPQEDVYSRLEKLDVDELVSNPHLLEAYLNCLTGTGKCTPEGIELKKIVPEGIQSTCGKCTEKQKSLVGRVMKASMDKLPERWDQLVKLHNSDGQYDANLKEFLAKYGQ